MCSVARALEVVGERWTLLILRDAFLGVRRFDDFQRSLGDRPQRPQHPPAAARRGGPARAAPLPGAPRALRVPPDRAWARPVARRRRADAVGRPPPRRPRRPADGPRAPRLRRRRSTTAASARACGADVGPRDVAVQVAERRSDRPYRGNCIDVRVSGTLAAGPGCASCPGPCGRTSCAAPARGPGCARRFVVRLHRRGPRRRRACGRRRRATGLVVRGHAGGRERPCCRRRPRRPCRGTPRPSPTTSAMASGHVVTRRRARSGRGWRPACR